MHDREPTIRSRELGLGLRQAMEYAGFTQSGMARELDWDASRVSRLLSGKRGGSGYDIAAFLAICRVHGAEFDRLMALSTDRARIGWHQQHGRALPRQVRTLIDHEKKSLSISGYQGTLVPGLLQTGAYARAVISSNVNVPDDEVEDRVEARLARRSLIDRKRPPNFTFFMHEHVLRTPVGDSTIMSEQLHDLLRVSVRPYLTLRILPCAAGAHAGMSGHFTLMDVKGFKEVVYLDSETSSLFLETPIEIDSYRNVLAALHKVALDEGQSKEMIATVATELYAE